MTQLDAPRRVLLGNARFRLMLTRTALAWWPALVSFTFLAGFKWWPVWLDGVFLVTVGVLEWRSRGRFLVNRLRAAWWRSWWWADCRSAGLCVNADPGLNAKAEGGRPAGVELAPGLVRLRVAGPVRLMTVRPLPGQTVLTFEKAIPALAFRWSGQVTVIEHPRRRRLLLVEVVTADVLASPIEHPTR